MLQPCGGLKVAVDCVLIIYLNWIIPQGSSLVCVVSDPPFDDCTIGLLHNAEILWLKERHLLLCFDVDRNRKIFRQPAVFMVLFACVYSLSN